MKFPYKSFTIQPTSAFEMRTKLLRPIIPIRLSYSYKAIGYEALLDSGADFSIIHADVGIYLGIPIKKGLKESFGGIIGKQSTAYIHDLSITLGGNRFHKVPIGFSYTLLTRFCNFFVRKMLLNQSRRSYTDCRIKCKRYTI